MTLVDVLYRTPPPPPKHHLTYHIHFQCWRAANTQNLLAYYIQFLRCRTDVLR
jgi:hypothetical protein